MPMILDASSLHPSTRLALMALDWLEERIQPPKILEIGCGSGVLTLASAQLWDTSIVACDISPNAVNDTLENARNLTPEADITVLRSDGLKHPTIAEKAPYGLIIGNLLAQWHVAMATDIANCLVPGGTVLVAGILLWQEEGTLAAFKALNMQPIHKLSDTGWQCYVLRHNPG